MQLLDFQFICYTSTKLQILIECYTLYMLLTSGTCDHGRTFYLSVVVSVPPLSVTILRTEVPLVAGVARRLECEVSSNRYNISAYL